MAFGSGELKNVVSHNTLNHYDIQIYEEVKCAQKKKKKKKKKNGHKKGEHFIHKVISVTLQYRQK